MSVVKSELLASLILARARTNPRPLYENHHGVNFMKKTAHVFKFLRQVFILGVSQPSSSFLKSLLIKTLEGQH